ncbi:MAG: hypothetical protein KBS54_03680 [Synergistaceae bacterium]|nr:hypothetical protein [Candidatus Equadaptatus faecalis]
MRNFKKLAAVLMLVSFICAAASPAMATPVVKNGRNADDTADSTGIIIYDDSLETSSGGEHVPKAKGSYSTAMGYHTNASSANSTAMGHGTTASGANSTAMGYGTTSSGNYSTSMGYGTTA